MADIAPLQADHLPGDLIPRSIVPQQHNPLRRGTGVSLECRDILPLVNVHLSVYDVL